MGLLQFEFLENIFYQLHARRARNEHAAKPSPAGEINNQSIGYLLSITI